MEGQAIVKALFHKFCFLTSSAILLSLPALALELPAGTALEARMSGATGSRISRSGDPIEATIIAPVSKGGRILVPQGSKLLGSITNVSAVGLGLKNSRA